MVDVSAIRERYPALCDHLDERAKRIFAATEARTAGYGGIAAVSRAPCVRVVAARIEWEPLGATEDGDGPIRS
jgi:hypothetical protein